MKLLCLLFAFVSLLFVSLTTRAEDSVANLQIGAPAPDFALPGIDGKTDNLADYADGKVLMTFFTSNPVRLRTGWRID